MTSTDLPDEGGVREGNGLSQTDPSSGVCPHRPERPSLFDRGRYGECRACGLAFLRDGPVPECDNAECEARP